MKTLTVLSLFALAFTSNFALAAGNTKGDKMDSMMKPTKEAREKMAAHHEKMAACLRSDKDFKACHDEMRAACENEKGAGFCPGMGKGGGMHHGMHGEKHDHGDKK